VILDLHHYEDPQGNLFADPAGRKARFTALWKQIATRFKDRDGQVWFELINEPHGSLGDTNLLSVLQPALDEVRKTNATRPVVIGGQGYSGIASLATLKLPNDPDLIVTFHSYDPYDFTYQGAPFVSPIPPTGRILPSGTDLADLNANVQKAKGFMASVKRPVFIGEYGAYEADRRRRSGELLQGGARRLQGRQHRWLRVGLHQYDVFPRPGVERLDRPVAERGRALTTNASQANPRLPAARLDRPAHSAGGTTAPSR
jgi:hypothetical protein